MRSAHLISAAVVAAMVVACSSDHPALFSPGTGTGADSGIEGGTDGAVGEAASQDGPPGACAAGNYRCMGDLLERCRADLSGFEAVQQCLDGFCDAAGKQCDICVPGSGVCHSQSVVLRCSQDGQSLHSEPCSGSTPSCIEGQCSSCLPERYPVSLPAIALYLMADRSGSMTGQGWTGQSSALNAFFADPNSTGMGVALAFFPLNDLCQPSSSMCNGDTYVKPLVEWGSLPANQPSLSASVSSQQPNGCFTPTQEALTGGLRGATARQLDYPDQTVALVLLSDGEPCCSDCPAETAPALGQIAAEYYSATPSIRTFTISMYTGASQTMAFIAQQGGGTSYETGVDPSAIALALSSVRDALGCEIAIPDPAALPEQIRVEYTASPGSSSVELVKHDNVSGCGSGWYFDDNVSPSTIHLCSTSCAEARGGGTTELLIDSCQ